MKKVYSTILGFVLALPLCIITPAGLAQAIQIVIWLTMIGVAILVLNVRKNPTPKSVSIPVQWSQDNERQLCLVREMLKTLANLIVIMELAISIGIYFEEYAVLAVGTIALGIIILAVILGYSRKIEGVADLPNSKKGAKEIE